jgi:50S ribosomal protein L16 3-hydroxylase
LRRDAGAPLQLLADFRPSAEYVLEAGDMLYLPPGVAHEGTAIGESITYSIGFRAPTHQELLDPFLADVAARTRLVGRYEDRGRLATQNPGALPAHMMKRLHAALAAGQPRLADTAHFLLGYLSEPKAQVVFQQPGRPLRLRTFAERVGRSGVVLDRRTRLLYRGRMIGINGEVLEVGSATRKTMHELADRRSLPPDSIADAAIPTLHGWYCAGWLHLDGRRARQ